jgi:hypothetical protein
MKNMTTRTVAVLGITTVALTALADAPPFRPFSIEESANRRRASFNLGGFTGGDTYPTGLQFYNGVPLQHGSDDAYAFTADPLYAGAPTDPPPDLHFALGVPGDTLVHLAIGIWCQQTNCCAMSNQLLLTVSFEDGSTMAFDLAGGTDVRDHNQGISNGGVCTPTASTTREVWRNASNQVLDLVTIDLANPGLIANSLRIESPDAGFYAFVFGLTAEYREDCDGDGIVDLSEILDNPKLDRDGDFRIDSCFCPADIDENALVDGVDLAIVLSRWGTLPTDYPRADTNGDGTVDGSDLATLLSGWGACP